MTKTGEPTTVKVTWPQVRLEPAFYARLVKKAQAMGFVPATVEKGQDANKIGVMRLLKLWESDSND